MQSLKLLSSSNSWSDLNKKLEELTKSGQAKLAGDIFENVCKYFLQTAPQYQTKLKNVWLLKEVKDDLRQQSLIEKITVVLFIGAILLSPLIRESSELRRVWRKEERFKQYY